ncbi:MAG: phospholipase D family protein [Candidatus Alcyoniella australis]|nr:phospholipase D family protein [Candidatus Alcyoniella australis]
MDGLFANTNRRRDFLFNAFSEYSVPPCRVYIASAFFTNADIVLDLAKRKCRIQLVVRLGYPTDPKALKSVLNKEGIQVRFFTDTHFHPKLYIFDERCAIVGSANLTKDGLERNIEVNVAVGVDDPRYTELMSLFVGYWGAAKVFDARCLDVYTREFEKYHDGSRDLDQKVKEVIGEVVMPNITLDRPKQSASGSFLEEYRKTYQEFLDAHRTVERVYRDIGRRKVPNSELPLRLEIAEFLSFVRETYTKGDSYLAEPILSPAGSEDKTRKVIQDWHEKDWHYIFDTVVPKFYPTITRILGSPALIDRATMEEMIEAFSCEHSFYDRLRFYPGGHAAHMRDFKQRNNLVDVRNSVKYLLYGQGDFIERMGRCIFDPAYKIQQFGRSNVQELLGWVNNEDIPICNNRMLRAIRWLGFDVKLVGD